MEIYKDADLGVTSKEDDSPLTRADQAANDIIVEELRRLELRAPIISEESRQVPYSERSQYTRFWLVDPLDGTKEFIKRNGEFTVNISLIDTRSPVLAVVYVPARDELYYAVRRRGAFRLQEGGEPQRLEAPAYGLQDAGLRVVASRSHLNEETRTFIDRLNEPEIVSKGSSLKILMVAAGEADLYPRMGPTSEWDIAAAQLILEEAGGRLIATDTGEPLLYNKQSLLNPWFIAYGRTEESFAL